MKKKTPQFMYAVSALVRSHSIIVFSSGDCIFRRILITFCSFKWVRIGHREEARRTGAIDLQPRRPWGSWVFFIKRKKGKTYSLWLKMAEIEPISSSLRKAYWHCHRRWAVSKSAVSHPWKCSNKGWVTICQGLMHRGFWLWSTVWTNDL
jgi:hypothetical protein